MLRVHLDCTQIFKGLNSQTNGIKIKRYVNEVIEIIEK